MDVSLTPELERQVAEKIRSGQYVDASDIVQKGLSMLFESEERLKQLRAEIQLGLDQLDNGETISAEMALATITRRLESQHRA